MPNLLRPVQFGQASAEITDYSIGMMVFQNHTILQLLRDVSWRMTTWEKSNIAGSSLLCPEFTALSLFLSPIVERALLRRTKNLTSKPWREKRWTPIISKKSCSPSRGLQPGASDRLPTQPEKDKTIKTQDFKDSLCAPNSTNLTKRNVERKGGCSYQDMHDVVRVA